MWPSMDIKQVNSAINYHRPGDSNTYLRPEQASSPKGLAITFVSSEKILSEVQGHTEGSSSERPDEMHIVSSIEAMGEDAPFHRA
ncbi:spliceosome RNA helicase DDX39B-like [Prionailurus viverrinus]|uniref:spliceosome RNA helicase DDX39B-like n=1 Tax=Prionailurus viverrinus TaxID=61388 RepID=UPI001FF1536B|nr:spliceosome RNA helicase DDX39B-like [Prionailurus viverrinus]